MSMPKAAVALACGFIGRLHRRLKALEPDKAIGLLYLPAIDISIDILAASRTVGTK